MKTLEEERDYFKGEVEVLNKIMKNKALASTSTPSSPSRSRTSSPSRSSTKTKVRCRMEPLCPILVASNLVGCLCSGETKVFVREKQREYY